MLNPLDLQRVAADRAAAILVLCNKFTAAPGRGSLAVFVLILKCSDVSFFGALSKQWCNGHGSKVRVLCRDCFAKIVWIYTLESHFQAGYWYALSVLDANKLYNSTLSFPSFSWSDNYHKYFRNLNLSSRRFKLSGLLYFLVHPSFPPWKLSMREEIYWPPLLSS